MSEALFLSNLIKGRWKELIRHKEVCSECESCTKPETKEEENE